MKELTEVRMLKEGKYVIIEDEPCTIMSMTHSKPGKHGSAKARIEGIGVFDSQKRTVVQPVTAKIYVPIIERRTGQVLSVMDDTVQVMDLEIAAGAQGELYLEIKIPDELKDKGRIEPGKEIPFLHYEGKYKIV
jgi:translation initiation factor 5A